METSKLLAETYTVSGAVNRLSDKDTPCCITVEEELHRFVSISLLSRESAATQIRDVGSPAEIKPCLALPIFGKQVVHTKAAAV